ncbi:hypothetical protein M422DRAFT_34292 [Sphaerobolus stellatus SS14]|uniref:DUF7770 domain-containing protein n=1 Tax=Sphaerobolus stellatus (strain SS14) TaxID=990650 RepID=A0A0C9U0Q6_SPHS4|nr:hypothetical protein M422DRAFT_34292 [Sphaerobolus stellatus SS14]
MSTSSTIVQSGFVPYKSFVVTNMVLYGDSTNNVGIAASGNDDDVKSISHWRIALELEKDPKEFEKAECALFILNMMPGADLNTGILTVSRRINQLPSTTAKFKAPVISLPWGDIIDAETFINIILRNGRDRFKFTNGRGSRHWCGVILHDFQDAGLVSAGSYQEFMMHLEEENKKDPVCCPLPVAKGTFY